MLFYEQNKKLGRIFFDFKVCLASQRIKKYILSLRNCFCAGYFATSDLRDTRRHCYVEARERIDSRSVYLRKKSILVLVRQTKSYHKARRCCEGALEASTKENRGDS
jgi:hypothetical protein